MTFSCNGRLLIGMADYYIAMQSTYLIGLLMRHNLSSNAAIICSLYMCIFWVLLSLKEIAS